jgi:hypothetical protein
MWTAASRQFPEGFSLRDQLGDGLTRQSSTANPAPSQKPTGTFHVQELLCQEPVLVRLGQARLKFADHASGHTACGGCGDLLPFHSGEGDHGLTRGDHGKLFATKGQVASDTFLPGLLLKSRRQ